MCLRPESSQPLSDDENGLYTLKWPRQRFRSNHSFNHHGQPQKETSSEDVEAQTSQAFEGQSSQEAHLAEVGASRTRCTQFSKQLSNPLFRAGFLFFYRWRS
jgi:hypothetical protein